MQLTATPTRPVAPTRLVDVGVIRAASHPSFFHTFGMTIADNESSLKHGRASA